MSDGGICNVSRLDFGVHSGTHIDAPIHFVDGARAIETVPLDVCIGPALVVDASAHDGHLDAAAIRSLPIPPGTRRVLFRWNSALWREPDFQPGFRAVTGDGGAALIELGVELVGNDYLSIAPFDAPIPTHRTLLEAGVVIVEGLDLTAVEPGSYRADLRPASHSRFRWGSSAGTPAKGAGIMSRAPSNASPPSASAPAAGSQPANAKVVLSTLILVAAVANLNLSVANVALPDIGKSFDSSQTTLDLIAVGYSLGLAASVLWFGALGDRYGRKLMIVLGMSLSIPASLVAGLAPSDTTLFVARVVGRPRRRHGVSDDARAHHRAVVRPGAHAIDRPLVRARRRSRGPRAAGLRPAPGAFRLGFRVPGHRAAGRPRLVHGPAPRARPHRRIQRQGRQPRWSALRRRHRDPGAGPELHHGSKPAVPGRRPVRHRRDRSGAVRRPPAARAEPALRPEDRRSPDVLGGSGRRHHRVRLIDGHRLRQPAVPAERSGLFELPGGCGDPARGRIHGHRRAPLGGPRPSARLALHAAARTVDAGARLHRHAGPVG